MNSKQRGYQPATGHILKLRKAAMPFGLLIFIAPVTLALLTSACYQQYTLSGAYAREYEGKILDKSQTITESRTGSGVRRRLLIEGRGGEKFEVAIGAETYERAQKGMWIRKTEAGVELTWPATPTITATTATPIIPATPTTTPTTTAESPERETRR